MFQIYIWKKNSLKTSSSGRFIGKVWDKLSASVHSVRSASFADLRQLRHLEVSFNRLKSVEKGTFDQLEALDRNNDQDRSRE